MTRDDVALKIINHLRLWKKADINQEPYRSDLFDIFAYAFNAGMLTGRNDLNVDVLTGLILSRGQDVVDDSHPCTNWGKFRNSWEEWTYAWNHRSRLGDTAT